MNCPKCNGNCQLITDTRTEGKDFSGGKACCGYLAFGWIGILCGACGEGKTTTTSSYWVCTNCGYKFKV